MKKIFRWSIVSSFMRLKIAQAASFVPLLGYAIIYNDRLKPFMSWSLESSPFWLDSSTRLSLLYFGCWLLLLALLLFVVFCPDFIRRHPHIDDFSMLGEQAIPNSRYEKILETIPKLVAPQPTEENTSHLDKRGRVKIDNSAHVKFEFSESANCYVRDSYTASEVAKITVRDHRTRNVLRIHFLQNERACPLILFVTLLLISLGGAMALLPSLEVAVLAIRTIFV